MAAADKTSQSTASLELEEVLGDAGRANTPRRDAPPVPGRSLCRQDSRWEPCALVARALVLCGGCWATGIPTATHWSLDILLRPGLWDRFSTCGRLSIGHAGASRRAQCQLLSEARAIPAPRTPSCRGERPGSRVGVGHAHRAGLAKCPAPRKRPRPGPDPPVRAFLC